MTRTLSSAAIVAALSLLSFAARADEATNAAVATELFNAGRTLMQQGDYAAACPKLQESARLDPKVGTLAKLAECEEHGGHLVAARARWQQALNLARASSDPREGRVAAELARIDAQVPKLRIATARAPADGVTVRVDDLDVGAGALGVPLPVEAGDHVVSVGAPGKKTWSTRVTAKAGGSVIRVDVPALEDAPAPPAPVVVAPPASVEPQAAAAPPSTAPPPSGPRPLRVAGFVTIGAGVVAAGVGGFLGLRALGRYHDSNDAGCNGASCPPAAATIRDDARSLGNASTAVFIASGALVASGIVLVVLAPSPRASITASPLAGPRTAGLALGGSW